MPDIIDDVPAGSSPAGATKAAPPAAGAAAAPTGSAAEENAAESTPESAFATSIDKLEEGKGAETVKREEAVAQSEAGAQQDEPAPGADGATTDPRNVESEAALKKAFDERPEWKKALSLVPREQVGTMRDILRGVLTRENEVLERLETVKPVLASYGRLQTAVGDDPRALDGVITLAELHAKADPRARELLMLLLNDLDSRTGSVLTSPDLKKRGADIDELAEAKVIDAAEAQTRKADLLEIERSRATERGARAMEQNLTKTQQRRSFETQQEALNVTCNQWEQETLKSDPDYPSLKEVVEQRAYMIGMEEQQKLKNRLLNTAEMKKILDDALVWSKDQAARFKPAPRARSPLSGSSGGSSAQNSRRAPANAAEEFDQEIERLEARRR